MSSCSHTLVRLLRVLACLSLFSPVVLAQETAPEPRLEIPWSLTLENEARSWAVTRPDSLRICAPAKTDLYVSASGGHKNDRSPRLVFRPAGPFILTAKVTPGFMKKWDAGVLLLYNDGANFAKFCYERDYQGTARIVSVVANGQSDDCNGTPVPEGAVYMRIVGSPTGNVFTFYSSKDGKRWYLERHFWMARTDKLRVGFSAQSPVGEGCEVEFSEIRVEQRALKDFWAGD